MKKNTGRQKIIKLFKILPYLLLVFMLWCSSSEETKQQKIIAKIGAETLTLENLKEVISPQHKYFLTHEQLQNYIQRWIDQELLYQEAMRLGMHHDSKLMEAIKKARKDFLVNKLLDSLMTEDIRISEEEIQDYYQKNQDNFTRAKPAMRALHILITDRNEANVIRRRILQGEEFEKVAKEVSLDYARNKRIDMGYFTPDDVVPEIAASVFNWRVGSVTRPIKSEFGYHIFKILDKIEADSVRALNTVKDQIIDRLAAKKREDNYRNYISRLRSRIKIQTNYDYLNELYVDTMSTIQDTISTQQEVDSDSL